MRYFNNPYAFLSEGAGEGLTIIPPFSKGAGEAN